MYRVRFLPGKSIPVNRRPSEHSREPYSVTLTTQGSLEDDRRYWKEHNKVSKSVLVLIVVLLSVMSVVIGGNFAHDDTTVKCNQEDIKCIRRT